MLRPKMNTLAFRVEKLRAEGKEAEALLTIEAENRIRRAWDQPEWDPAEDMTDLPMEGGFTFGRHRD